MALSIRFCQVVRIFPKFKTYEIVFMDDGTRVTNVPCLNAFVSSDTGGWASHNTPRPENEDVAGGLHTSEEDRTVMGVVAMVDDRPLILGFLPHPLTQMAFVQTEQNRDIWRHPSGTVATINRNGSMEIQHTGGCFVRIAAQVDSEIEPDRHEDLTPLCWNENWVLPENEPATVTVSTGNLDGEAFKARIRPNGDTDIYSSGNLTISYAKDCTVNIGGDTLVNTLGETTVNSQGDVSVRTPATATVTAGSGAYVESLGECRVTAALGAIVESEGPIEVATPLNLDLYGSVINLISPLTVVWGELLMLESPIEAEAAVAARAVVTAANLLAAGANLAEAEAELAQAAIDIEMAVLEAVETSEPARGTGPPDNLGGPRPGESSMDDEGEWAAGGGG